jgi:hypothetical protein
MRNLDDERRQTGQRAHLESGIFRKKIAAAYFDATRAGMKPDECIREAITAGALDSVDCESLFVESGLL